MSIEFGSGVLAFAALVVSVTLFAARWHEMQSMPLAIDRSRPKGSASQGVLYAFTLGMAPWAKESTRRHMIAYLRGIAFHVGIFAGLAAFVLSPFYHSIPGPILYLFACLTGLGAVMGAAGGILRITESNLRAISLPDDHLAVWLVSFFLAGVTLALLLPPVLPATYVIAAVMLIYAPVGKIKHCIYFYFGRMLYGLHIGRRGIVPGLVSHSAPLRTRDQVAHAMVDVRRQGDHGR